MKCVSKTTVFELVRRIIPHLAFELPQDVSAGMCAMCQNESNSVAKSALDQLCENDAMSRSAKTPICQDTGTVRVVLQLGKNVAIAGNVFDEVNAAVAEAYIKNKLRLSTVKDSLVDRQNTGDNTPAFCEIQIINELDVARLCVMLKGGGSDNASRVVMLVPGDGRQGIIDEVVRCVREKATCACPPIILGIGIGGTFDSVAGLAQQALYRPIGEHAENDQVAAFEQEILDAVNATHVGAAGLGGASTCQQVNIITAPSHIAAMPLAIDMGCSALRRATIDIPLSEERAASLDDIEQAISSALEINNIQNKRATDFVAENVRKNSGAGSTLQTKEVHLNLPLSKDDLKNLHAGDKVYLTGPIYTLRDAGHIRLLEEMKTGELPYGLKSQTIFYAGPSPAKNGQPFGSIGPTTSGRMDFATPTVYDAGVVATIGKGKRNQAVHDACVKNGAVYFATIGGCASYLAQCIKSAELVAYEDLGPEALRRCEVQDFPVYVGIDTYGEDIYE